MWPNELRQVVVIINLQTKEIIHKCEKKSFIQVGNKVSTFERRGEPSKLNLPACKEAKVIKISIEKETLQIHDPVEGKITIDASQIHTVYRAERNSDASDALCMINVRLR